MSERTYHVAFDSTSCSSSSCEVPASMLNARKIRTFFLPGKQGPGKRATQDALISSFTCLRMLDLHYSGIENVPTSNLQTLKLSNCYELRKLHVDFRKLVRLRHLEIEGCNDLSYMTFGLGELTCLQSLPIFIVGKDSSISKAVGGIEDANFFHGLAISLFWRFSNSNLLVLVYIDNNNIQSSSFAGAAGAPSSSRSNVMSAARGGSLFPALKKLLLFDLPLLKECLVSKPFLSSLEKLFITYVSEKLFQAMTVQTKTVRQITEVATSGPSFPLCTLRTLHICSCEDLVSSSELGLRNLTSLRDLHIIYCHKLVQLPEDGLRDLVSVQSLQISSRNSLTSLSLGIHNLTALRKLQLFDCEAFDWLDEDDGV
ncbi:hypothetical protein ACSBR1_017841 [Camellia fascicularis]